MHDTWPAVTVSSLSTCNILRHESSAHSMHLFDRLSHGVLLTLTFIAKEPVLHSKLFPLTPPLHINWKLIVCATWVSNYIGHWLGSSVRRDPHHCEEVEAI